MARHCRSAPNQQFNRDGVEMFKNSKHVINSDNVAFGKEAIRETMARLARAGTRLNCQTVPQGAIAWIIAESAMVYDHNCAWSIMESARQEMIADRQLDAPIFSLESWHILKPKTVGVNQKSGL